MTGYMYILQCADGYYYVGSTNNLEVRIQQHQNGLGANFTKKHLPVELVYYEIHSRIDEAFHREKQVQGWSRQKKEALIQGFQEKLPNLAKNYKQNVKDNTENYLVSEPKAADPMASIITIRKPNQKLKGSITLPASKSISNRLLMIRAYAGADFKISNLSAADDTSILQQLLEKINSTQRIVLDCYNAGTTCRFLLPYLANLPGEWILTGSDRMKQRPIAPLVDALRQLGADIEYLEETGFPPLRICGRELRGGKVSLDSSSSSQFSSALMMMGAFLPDGLAIELIGKKVSQPYIKMTAKLLSQFGIGTVMKDHLITVSQQPFQARDVSCEPDWSAASYWYELACLSVDAEILLKDLHFTGLQGDEAVAGLFYRLGVQSEDSEAGIIIRKGRRETDHFVFDFSHNPDLAMTLAVTAAGLGISAELSGLHNLVIKESNRLEALYHELKKVGCTLTAGADGLLISPSTLNSPDGGIRTYADHRIAMAFAPLVMVLGEITVCDPAVTGKSYPDYWTDLGSMGFGLDFCE